MGLGFRKFRASGLGVSGFLGGAGGEVYVKNATKSRVVGAGN